MQRNTLLGLIFLIYSYALIGQALEVPLEIDILQSAELSNYDIINTSELEFAPVFFEDGLLFIQSSPPDRKGRVRFELKYHAFLDSLEQARFVENALEDLSHFGPCAYDRLHKEIYYSENHKSVKASDKRYQMKLVRLHHDGEEWVREDDFPYNNYTYSIMHPSLSYDGKTLVFASNMPGGFGKMDLYQSTKTDTGWTQPLNLGAAINTDKNDWFPHLFENNYLFYASDGLQGLGGLDLFMSIRRDSLWDQPHNLGAPLNSASDDLGFAMSPDASYGFISSNRPSSKGQDDIYKFELAEVFFIEEKTEPVVDPIIQNIEPTTSEYSFSIVDKDELHGLDNVEIFYVPIVSNDDPLSIESLFLKNKVSADHMLEKELTEDQIKNAKKAYSSSDGKISLMLENNLIYSIEIAKPGYKKEKMLLDISGLLPETSLSLKKEVIPPSVAEPKPPIAVPLPKDFRRKRVLYKVKFQSNKSNITPRSATELSKVVDILNSYPQISIELAAHTDVLGPKDYNQEISQKRADSAKQYIVEQGIDPMRITAKGYGETKPANHCREGVVCTDDEHAANRRLELIVLDN